MKILTKASAGIAQWLGRTLSLGDSGFWRWYYGSDNYSGKTVTAQTALQLSAVWACVRLLSQVLGTLPVFLYHRDAKGQRTLATDHPLYTVLHDQPNANMTPADFWQCLIAAVALWGNGYALIHRAAGRIVALEPLRPELMVVKVDKSGALEFRYTDLKGVLTVYSEAEIFHIKGFSLDGLIGLSPIAFARNTLGAAMAQEETSSRIFANGLRPSGVVSTEQILTKGNREEIRKSVISQVGTASQSGSTLVLEAGMKYQPVTMNPEDAQLLQSRAFSIEEICRWFFNTPPILIGHSPQGQTMWGSGVEQVIMGWRVMGMGPLVIGIEQAIKRQLLKPEERRSYYSKFSLEGLMRADSAGRAQLYASKVQNGLANRNSIRELEDEEPYVGGDIYTVQSNLMRVDQLGQQSSGEQAKESIRSWLGLPTFEEKK
ncbi:phage portal protein [Achromobacter spanius]